MKRFGLIILGLSALSGCKCLSSSEPEGPQPPVPIRPRSGKPGVPPPADSYLRRPEPTVASVFDIGTEDPKTMLTSFREAGVSTVADARQFLSGPASFSRVVLLARIRDLVGLEAAAAEEMKLHPEYPCFAGELAFAQRGLGRPKQAFATIETALASADKINDDWSRQAMNDQVLPMRCSLMWQLRYPEDATRAACLEAWKKSPAAETGRAAAWLEISKKNFDESLSLLKKTEQRGQTGLDPFIAGVARFELDDSVGAKAEFQRAVDYWPMLSPAWRCLAGAKCNLASADEDLNRWFNRRAALDLIWASRTYRALGLPDDAEARLLAAEALDPGISLVERLAQAASQNEAAALPEATKALESSRHPELLALVAVETLKSDAKKAKVLLDEARTADPGDPYVNRALALMCERGDDDCVKGALLRAGHVEPRSEYVNSRATQVPSALNPMKASNSRTVTLVPYLEAEMPESEGLAEALQVRFPKLHFTVAPRRPTPQRWVFRDGTQIDVDSVLNETERSEGILLALFDRDLGPSNSNFAYGIHNPMTRSGAVSVSRFRNAQGRATEPGIELTVDERGRAKARLLAQVTSTLGKLLGMSAPCEEAKCVLRFPANMVEFDAKGTEFCDAHKAELDRLLP